MFLVHPANVEAVAWISQLTSDVALGAREAAAKGDGARSAAELHAAFEHGHRDYGTIIADPAYAPVLRDPDFQKVLVEMAGWWITRVTEIEDPNQMQLYQLASAYWLRGDFSDAQRTLERALALGGPFDDRIRAELARFPAHVPH